ncbi:hypothetical protein [Gloeothece verrucosa]|uniref:Uncharacterized protein n=1 Tax=Gloeothece verrucosa (strain PCC 7822) TaxID=497965 RepID=E0UJP5_GLOV7|nr:hypothetical protein [Gloeothece verrucosa]ADN12289.1 conserved hypothetical protein [Gloeothece verrucosa PCC 7822]
MNFKELDPPIQEILHCYKPALTYIGVDFSREDVQEAIEYAYDDLEARLQSVIEYWYFLQHKNQQLNYPSACLITALSEGWTPKNWQQEYLDNPNFKSPCLLWWEKAAEVWGQDKRNELVADVSETDDGYEYILFRSGKTLSLKIAQIWGWERVLDYGQAKSGQAALEDF